MAIVLTLIGVGRGKAPAMNLPAILTHAIAPSHAMLERRYARPHSRFITVEGVRMHVLDEGPKDGPAVVVLSSQWASISQWDGWADVFRDRYRFVRIELPGQGLTGPVPSGDHSLEHYRDLMLGALDQLRVDRFVLAGSSFSGALAFRYAGEPGTRVSALILANASGLPRTPGAGAAPNAPPPSGWLRAASPYWRGRAFFRWKLSQMLRNPARITPALVREYADFNTRRGRIAEAAARAAAYRAGDPFPILAAIQAPTLIQWSTHATYLPVSDAERFSQAITGAPVAVRIYRDVGHLIIQDAPEATGRDARAFVDAVTDRHAFSALS